MDASVGRNSGPKSSKGGGGEHSHQSICVISNIAGNSTPLLQSKLNHACLALLYPIPQLFPWKQSDAKFRWQQ